MPKNISVDFANALLERVVHIGFFVEFSFETSTERFWTGLNQITWDGKTWNGGAYLASIPSVKESSNLSANKIEFGINGVDASFQAIITENVARNHPCKWWFNIMDHEADPIAVKADYLLWGGRMDELNATYDKSNGTVMVSVTCENRLVELFRPSPWFYTDSDHQRVYLGDLGCQYVVQLAGKDLPWGGENTESVASSNSGPVVWNDANGKAWIRSGG